jgi:tetratricopeptide (TPR) repeat protein
MKKKITIIIVLLSIFLCASAQDQEPELDVFLNENMMKSTNLSVKFNSSIDYTSGNFLLLSSSNQFYALGLNGVFPVLNKTKNRIDAFSIATSDSILLFVSNKALYQPDTDGKMVKITDLPSAKMGVASDEDEIYLFEQADVKDKKEYSLYSLSRMFGLTELISVKTPINSVLKYQSELLFTSKDKIYYVVEDKDIDEYEYEVKYTYEEFFTLSDENSTIISLSGDVENQALYFSTADTVYCIKDNQLDYVCTDFGGTLRYDGKGLLIFNPEKSLVVRLRNNLLYPSKAKKPAPPVIDAANYLSDEKLKQLSLNEVRQLVLQNRISEAVGGYSYLLAKDSTNTSLLAESSYALALIGAYDCALMNLDRVRMLSPQSAEVQFYMTLVFSLMGYGDLQNIPNKNIPKWISYDKHVELSKTRSQAPQLMGEDYIAAFRRANYLAAAGLYLQSIALYEEIIKAGPQEFLPYAGYSVVLEKAGFYQKALQELETGISLMPNSLSSAKAVFEKRKTELADKINAPDKLKNKLGKLKNDFNPQTMLYAGGMISKSFVSLNSRFGLFVNSTFNGAVDLGLSGNRDAFNVNLGVSGYKRFWGFLAWGEGVNLQTGSSTVFSLKSSLGFSFINRKRNSSWDIFFDWYLPLSKDKSMYGMSIGKSIYWGNRKKQ